MMWGYGDWGAWGWLWPFHVILPILFWVVVIVGIVLLVRSLTGRERRHSWPNRHSPGLDVLEERYARGEISREEYLEKKRDILGS